MPTLKTEILGSAVEINYEEAEKDKLIKIIEKFNERLSDLKHLQGKVTDNKILFLAALKAEDQVIDLINNIETISDDPQRFVLRAEVPIVERGYPVNQAIAPWC